VPWRPLPDPDGPQPAPVGIALDAVLRDLRAPTASVVRSIFDSWSDVVGPQIAQHATPASLQDGVLVLAVSDPAWATQLRFLQADLLAKVVEALGPGEVTEIDVRVRRARG
jgi:predicted nucleic acid-binding Zn ribbon protein